MEQEWNLPMEFLGKPCGSAMLRREGLYLLADCRCSRVTDEIVRARLETESEWICLGVLAPEGQQLTLTRRMPMSRVPAPPYMRVTVFGKEEPWKPWSGEVEGYKIEHALARQEGGGSRIALPFAQGQPLEALPLFQRTTPETIEGQTYLTVFLPGLALEEERDYNEKEGQQPQYKGGIENAEDPGPTPEQGSI